MSIIIIYIMYCQVKHKMKIVAILPVANVRGIMQAYEDEVRSKGTGVNRSLHKLFDTLAGRGPTAYTGTYV